MPDFSQKDIEQIKKHGLSIDTITQQLKDFHNGFAFADIVSPATIGNGIHTKLNSEFADFF